MSGDLDRRFPFDLRPGHRETVESYSSRLLAANFCTDQHRAALIRQVTTSARKADQVEAWMTVLAHKTKRTLHLAADPSGWMTHADDTSCDDCRAGLPPRVRCTLCSRGAEIAQSPHFDDLVCVPHRRWVGLTTRATSQGSVPQSIVDAAVLFAKLRRQHRLDFRFYRVLNTALAATLQLPADTPELFLLTVNLAAAVTEFDFVARFYDPASRYADSHQLLGETVTLALGEHQPEITRTIWLYARPTFWAVRDAIITQKPFRLSWAHDLPLPASITRYLHLRDAPEEAFSEYLAVTGDTQLSLARHGLTVPDPTAARLTQVGGRRAALTICAAGHQFEAPSPTTGSLADGREKKCPVCRSQVVVPGYNDLATTHTDIAAEFDIERNGGLTAADVTANSRNRCSWRCAEAGHSFESTPSNRCYTNSTCPICNNRLIVEGLNDFASTHPELVEEIHPAWLARRPPTTFSAGSKVLIRWICPTAGHEYDADTWKRTSGTGCGQCRGDKNSASRVNITVTHPELSAQWHPSLNGTLTPDRFTAGSKTSAHWLCPVGHDYRQRIERRVAGYKCSVCSRRRLVPGVNDLVTTEPILTREWHPYMNHKNPNEIFAGTDKFWWLCSNKHKYQQSVPHRVKSKGCPECPPDKRITATYGRS